MQSVHFSICKEAVSQVDAYHGHVFECDGKLRALIQPCMARSFIKSTTGLKVSSLGRVHHLFVYGTLMNGFCNHGLLASGEQSFFLGPAATEERLSLQLLEGRGLPVVTRHSAGPVQGEVYVVSNKILDLCDRLESHPTFYRREVRPIVLHDSLISAWIYMFVCYGTHAVVGQKVPGGSYAAAIDRGY